MRRLLLSLAVGCLFFLLCGPQAFADDSYHLDSRFWLKADVRQNYTDYVNRIGEQGQCSAQWVSVSKDRCVTYTQWGEVSEDGVRMSTSEFYPLQLTSGQRLERSRDSRRLYISEELGTGYMRLGYLENPQEDIVFDSSVGAYKLSPTAYFTFLPTQYKNIAFSNNSHFVIGETANGTLTRTALTDFSRKNFSGNEPSIGIAQTERWGISSSGNLVVGANEQNEMIAYELGYCSNDEPNICSTRKISAAQSMDSAGDKIYINDEGRGIALYSSPRGLRTSRISLSLNYDSLNRPVTYVALGDSFSSGEGAWNYEPGTDGSDEFPDEKCHQSENSYATKYFRHHIRWSDEYYEPSLDGDMVVWPNGFKNATCSGAITNYVQLFGSKYTVNGDAAKDFAGHFNQFDGLSREIKQISQGYAMKNNIPGRALQIDFLREYKPTIATVGIGGNDIGFADILKACIMHQGTCSAASSNKAVEGKKIQDEFWKLSALFNELHLASPNTRLYAVGYPQFIADNDINCKANVLLNAREREFVKEGTRYLNQVIKAAAKKNGLTYISFEDAIGSAGLCGDGTWGVNGLALGNDKLSFFKINGKDVYWIANESYHPSYIGQEMMADTLIERYGALDVYPNPNCPQIESGYCRDDNVRPPSIPKYFGDRSINATVLFKSGIETTRKLISLSLPQFKPGGIILLTAFSQETNLGKYQANEHGDLNIEIELPTYLEPGYHTLYASGIDPEGNELIYQQIFLYLPDDTQLGPCSFLPYSNLDQDEDGTDDACDPEISFENPLTFADPSEYLIYPNHERQRPIVQTPPAVQTVPLASAIATSAVLGQSTILATVPTNVFANDNVQLKPDDSQTPHTANNAFQLPTSSPDINTASDVPSPSNITPYIVAGGSILFVCALFLARKLLR